ncbi:MAG: integrase [Candidatus Nitrosotenuis sp.]|nr:MAG: integrase [Candidatus Nitrosotenuis sp.]
MQRLSRQKNREIIIHDYKAIIQNMYRIIEREFSEKNVELIRKYDRVLVNESLADSTRSKNISMILSLTRLLKKDWADTTKEDIENLIFSVNRRFSEDGQETNTTVDHKKILKRFYRWLKLGTRNFAEVGDPPETKWIKPKRVKDRIVREELISEDDTERLLRACGENLRDRAFVHCHIEAGTRPGEILNLRIKHVKFDKFGAVLHVDGKTGPRPVRLIRSTPDLASYLDKHPNKDDPDAPLWIMLGNTNYGKPLTYAAARKRILEVVAKANLGKRVYLNLFRHSEATMTANFLTEAQMRKRHGWSPSSKMPARYVHLVNADVDRALFEHYGIEKEKAVDATLPQICNICKQPNSFDSTKCVHCGKPLDIATAIRTDDEVEARFSSIERKLETLLSLLPQQSH